MKRGFIDLNGPISIIEYGGSGPLIVCVHGLEGSAYNWRFVAPALAERFTVVAPDLRGFGYSEPGNNPVTVEHNAQVVIKTIEEYGGPAVLVGNSMGGLVSMIAAAERSDLINALVLVDPAAPVASWRHVEPSAAMTLGAPLVPGLGERIVRAYRATRTPEEGVAESYRFVAAQPDAVPLEAYQDAVEIAKLRRTQRWSAKALVQATNSIAPYVLRKKKFLGVLHRVTQPTLLMHGIHDAVIQVKTAQWVAAQRPDWTVAYLRDLGHVAMIEDPDMFISIVTTWVDAVMPWANETQH